MTSYRNWSLRQYQSFGSWGKSPPVKAAVNIEVPLNLTLSPMAAFRIAPMQCVLDVIGSHRSIQIAADRSRHTYQSEEVTEKHPSENSPLPLIGGVLSLPQGCQVGGHIFSPLFINGVASNDFATRICQYNCSLSSKDRLSGRYKL